MNRSRKPKATPIERRAVSLEHLEAILASFQIRPLDEDEQAPPERVLQVVHANVR